MLEDFIVLYNLVIDQISKIFLIFLGDKNINKSGIK